MVEYIIELQRQTSLEDLSQFFSEVIDTTIDPFSISNYVNGTYSIYSRGNIRMDDRKTRHPILILNDYSLALILTYPMDRENPNKLKVEIPDNGELSGKNKAIEGIIRDLDPKNVRKQIKKIN